MKRRLPPRVAEAMTLLASGLSADEVADSMTCIRHSIYVYVRRYRLIYGIKENTLSEAIEHFKHNHKSTPPPPKVGHRAHPAYGKLTRRERTFVDLLASGVKTYSQIAHYLNLSESTVRWYAPHIYRKYGVTKKAELLEIL